VNVISEQKPRKAKSNAPPPFEGGAPPEALASPGMARLKPGDIVFLHESQEVADTLERWIEAIAPLAGHPFAAGLSDGVHVSKDELANPESRKKINVAERVVLAMSSASSRGRPPLAQVWFVHSGEARIRSMSPISPRIEARDLSSSVAWMTLVLGKFFL
jgi:hypothetical protein